MDVPFLKVQWMDAITNGPEGVSGAKLFKMSGTTLTRPTNYIPAKYITAREHFHHACDLRVQAAEQCEFGVGGARGTYKYKHGAGNDYYWLVSRCK